MPRTPERLSESPKSKPRSAPAKKPKKSNKLLKVAAVGGVAAGGAILGKRKWDSMSKLEKMKAGQKVVDAKIPFVSKRVDNVLTRKKTEEAQKMFGKVGSGVNDALNFLGNKLGITKKKPGGK